MPATTSTKLPWFPQQEGYLVVCGYDASYGDRIFSTIEEANRRAEFVAGHGAYPRVYLVKRARAWGRVDAVINWGRRLLVSPRASLRRGDGLYDFVALTPSPTSKAPETYSAPRQSARSL